VTYNAVHNGIAFLTNERSMVDLVRILLVVDEPAEGRDAAGLPPRWKEAYRLVNESAIAYQVEGLQVSRDEFHYWQNDPELDRREDGTTSYNEDGLSERAKARGDVVPLPVVAERVAARKVEVRARKARLQCYWEAGAYSYSQNARHETEVHFSDAAKAAAFRPQRFEVVLLNGSGLRT
jgi:hypothetical protein